MIAPGVSLGPYEVVGLLGAGGMGEVYRARDTRLEREVAVKVLPSELAADPERLRRFEQEARASAALSHPNIVAVFDVGRHDSAPYLVTELLEGESLRERLRRGGLSAREAVGLAMQVARGLAAAHGRGIVHRDLKPENLFVTRDGTVKILDFGLAKLTRPEGKQQEEAPTVSVSLTGAGKVLGTVGYMAPEQVRGLTLDHRADLFAFGCVLYEMLTGRRAFWGATAADTMSAILREDPPSLSASGAAVPPALETLVARCLEKRVEERFSSAHDLALALEAALGEAGSAPRVRPAAAGRRRAPRPVVGGVAAVALAAVVAGWLLWRPTGTPASADLDPRLVLVAPFEDLTGDPSLAPVARMVGDAVGQGLVETGLVRVAAPTAAGAGGAGDETLRAAARSAGAGLMVTGSVYLAAGDLDLRPRLTETGTGNLLYALDPAVGPRAAAATVVGQLRERVMGAVAAHLEPPPGLGRVVRPPPYRALREYEAGMVASGVDWDEARRRFENAVALAPDFWGAQLRLIIVYEAQGEAERQSALMSRLGDSQDAFSPFERLVFDLYQARAEDRRQDALRLTRLIRVEVPKDLFFTVLHAAMAMTERHPREVVDALRGIDDPGWARLTRGPQGEWALRMLASALHLLGEHEQELEVAERGLRLYSTSQDALQRKVRALAALGRVEEVERLVGVSQSTASEKMAAGEVALVAAQELRAHGRPDEARKLASRAADWYADLPAPDAGTDISRWNRLESLWVAERWNEARVLAESFAPREPSPRWSVLITGYRGALAARLGDERAARAADAELAAVTERRRLGFALYFRGAVAAHLGDRETAVERLRSALAVGSVTLDWIHTFVFLEPLQRYPPFEELLVTQG